MKESNVIYDKSFYFAIRIVNLFRYLKDERKEFITCSPANLYLGIAKKP